MSVRVSRFLKSSILNVSVILFCNFVAGAEPQESSVSDLQAKAQNGDASAQYELGRAYADGKGMAQNDATAVAWYRKASAQGNADAENGLGVMYMTGRGVEEDWADALHWYHEAARQKNAFAMFNLGAAYYNGDRNATGKDDAAAYAWFTLAKENGSSAGANALSRSDKEFSTAEQNRGLLHIAEMYLKGEELPQNTQEAERWLRVVAERGDSLAQLRLAAQLVSDPKPDYVEAYHWCRAAAQHGDPLGEYCVGEFYEKGLGTEKNSKEALNWYEKSAARGHISAMEAAAEILASGAAGKQDRPGAFVHFILAGVKDPKALDRAARIRAEMSKHEWKKTQEQLKHYKIDPASLP